MTKEKEFKSFEDFTNLYEVQKTLRFELKPVGKTQKMLEENKVFEKDKLIDDNYHKIKYYFDLLHRKFIKESLSEINLDFKEYYESFLSLKKGDKKTQDNLKKQEDVLRKILVENFNKKADKWKKNYKQNGIDLKKDGFEIFFEKDNLEILKREFKVKPNNDRETPDIEFIDPLTNKQKNLFESFKGFTTYFSNFYNSRRNFYSAKDKDTAISNRAINENLRRFCDNKKIFNDNKRVYEKIGVVEDEKKIFELNFYNNCLEQNGINKYNEIIGRRAKDEGGKGLNQKINEYKQKTKEKFQSFKMLDKQILGNKENDMEKFVEITSDEQVFVLLREFVKLNNSKNNQAKKLFIDFLSVQEGCELDKIYLKKSAINTISRKFFGENWQYFENALPKRETDSKEEKFKLDDFISIQTIKDALLGIQKNKKELPKKYQYLGRIVMLPKDLFKEGYAKKLADDNYQTFLNIWKSEFESCLERYEIEKEKAEKMILEEKYYEKSDMQIEKIKAYADASLAIYQMMKYFALEKGKKKVVDIKTDDNFYNNFGEYYNDYRIKDYYDEFRNYLTKKDFLGRLLFPSFRGDREQKHLLSKRIIDGAEKIKLNFDFSHDHKWGFLALLFRQNKNEYYIGIPQKGNDFKFKENKTNGKFEKMEYVQLKFKTLTGKGYIRDFKVKYSEQENQEAIVNVKTLIKKQYLDRYPLLAKVLDKKYLSKKEFGKHINELLDASYSAKFISINEDIFKINERGGLFLFKLNNKDFRTTGMPNLHTQYFRLLFEQTTPTILKLDSKIELFFRPKIKNLPIREKKDGEQMIFIDKRDKNKEKKVLQNRRYAEDKLFLHLSVIQNFSKDKIKNDTKSIKGYAKKFNASINEKILSGVNIIGIDRGENNLAYYSVIDRVGKIIENKSFNTLDVLDKDGKVAKTVDYLKLLETKAGDRNEARKNWKTIENIKELKNGYISQVVRKICDLVLKYNAIVVFEDLSGGFKRSRMKIEQQVYQKLELALVKKLNYLVNKNTQEGERGHYLKAYQLTSPIANYNDIGKQTGIIFYTQASYTSKTCPQCGFRKNVGFYFETKQKAEDEIKKLTAFKYDSQNNRFKIEYKLNSLVKEEKKNKKERDNLLFQTISKENNFVVFSNVIRYKWRDRKINEKELRRGEKVYKTEKENRGTVIEYDITECLIRLFEQNSVNYKSDDLKNAIAIKKDLSAEFYKDLFYYLFLLLNIRNSVSGADIDYIQCSQCGFDSRKGYQGCEFNGDANGSYNIARKGIMILEKIRQYKKKNGNLDKMNWGDLFIDIEEWDKFSQTINANKWNPTFKSQK
ncbi:type V CRISPR-associated protein Cas12a/Cpf1 [Candidatus Wolfebacteria bacterium]|nr:type V CRISPR-associated protein Cas12a/Cpf1 [Candidatus Wolfebacteria bacterium]